MLKAILPSPADLHSPLQNRTDGYDGKGSDRAYAANYSFAFCAADVGESRKAHAEREKIHRNGEKRCACGKVKGYAALGRDASHGDTHCGEKLREQKAAGYKRSTAHSLLKAPSKADTVGIADFGARLHAVLRQRCKAEICHRQGEHKAFSAGNKRTSGVEQEYFHIEYLFFLPIHCIFLTSFAYICKTSHKKAALSENNAV